MLSYKTPATLKAENAEGARILAEHNIKNTGVNSNGAELSAVQRKDFAAALEARKKG
jgi:hypothetical protein